MSPTVVADTSQMNGRQRERTCGRRENVYEQSMCVRGEGMCVRGESTGKRKEHV